MMYLLAISVLYRLGMLYFQAGEAGLDDEGLSKKREHAAEFVETKHGEVHENVRFIVSMNK